MALASQLLAASGTAPSPLDVLRHLGAIQLDAMQRVDKSHRLACFARIPALTGRDSADRYFWAREGTATAFEMWAHAVCLVPVEDWPLWGFRRQRARLAQPGPAGTCDQLIRMIRDGGPLTIGDLEADAERTSGWNWSETKKAAEHLVWSGDLVCCSRAGSRRLYDLPERRIPADLLHREISAPEAIAALVMKAARAYGVATVPDLAAYFQLPRASVATAVRETELIPARVEGWPETGWIHPAALGMPVPDAGPVFLSPFDNLIWDRARTHRLFGFSYTLEAYKPAAKRVYGYYVMPLLAGAELCGRADLARNGQLLTVLQFHSEPGHSGENEAAASAAARLARQLGCTTGSNREEDERRT